MLEYWWMESNETEQNGSDVAIEELLQDPSLVVLFVDYPRWLLNFAAACCVLFMLIGIPGNLITVIALFRTKKLKNATAVFIMNLSISDLMFGCFNLPLAISTFWHGSWLHGPLLCRLFPLLRYGLVAVSLFTVLAITINRYVMISHPGLYPTLYKTRYLVPMILATWIIAFGVLIVTWFERWGRFGLDPIIGSCSILPDVNGRSPKEFLFVIAFLMPCLVIIVCYARIFHIVRKTASKSRGRDKIVNVEPIEISHEQRSTSTRHQEEEELSVLCASSSPTRMVFLRPDEEIDLESSSRSPDRDSFSSKQPLHDRCEVRPTITSHTNEPEVNTNVSPNPGGGDETFDTSFTAAIPEDILFADGPDVIAETKRFLNRNQSSCDPQRRVSRSSCRLNRMTSRPSFIMDSSLWDRGIASSSLNRPEIFVNSRSHSPERPAKRTSRRESRLRAIISRARNGCEPSTPRMSTKDRKLLQMILVIFSSFVVCYLPITVTKLFPDAVGWRGLNIAGYVLIYLTTCINPVIYVVMSSEYRSAYKYVLLCRREQVGAKRRPPGLLTPS